VSSARRVRPQHQTWHVVLWAALPVATMGTVVQLTHTGVDVLLVSVACLLVVALQRSIGDWIGELVGAAWASLVFAICVVGAAWYFLDGSGGAGRTQELFATAERHGYRTVLFTPSSRPASSPRLPNLAPQRVVATGGSSGGSRIRFSSPPDSGPETSADSTQAKPAEPSGPPSRQSRFSSAPSDESAPLIASTIWLDVSASRIAAAQRAIIRAFVRAAGKPVMEGSVEFTVGGMGAGVAPLGVDGIAVTTYSSHLPGTYEVRARFRGTVRIASASKTLTLTVLPSR
jgi:hypothetical protein